MKTVMFRAALVAAVLACGLAIPGYSSPSYVMTDLSLTAGLGEADAYAVNDCGVVTGHRRAGSSWKAYSWERSSGWQDLGELPGGLSSWGGAINSSGTIAGWSWIDATGRLHAVVWKPGQPVTDLGCLPGNYMSDAMDINDAGWVCGHAPAIDGKNHAVVWDADGAIQDLGCLPGDNYSYAQAIANNGLVVGYSFSNTDYVSDMFCWTQADGMVNVGRPAGAKSATPWKVNNRGQAACHIWSSSGRLSYSLWSAATGFVDSSTYGLRELYDINDRGMMLGTRMSDGRLGVRYPDGSFSAIETPAGQTLVTGMNNRGWVTGFNNSTHHALLWMPVPEPPLAVAIDIKPGSGPNNINLGSKGVVPVAILHTEDFDASTVDPSTVIFAGASPLRWALTDVDLDGNIDMILHFDRQTLELSSSSVYAELEGMTICGMPIRGEDSLSMVPTK